MERKSLHFERVGWFFLSFRSFSCTEKDLVNFFASFNNLNLFQTSLAAVSVPLLFLYFMYVYVIAMIICILTNCWSTWFYRRSLYMKQCPMKWGFLKDWNKKMKVLVFWTYWCRLYLIYEKSFEAVHCILNGCHSVWRTEKVSQWGVFACPGYPDSFN